VEPDTRNYRDLIFKTTCRLSAAVQIMDPPTFSRSELFLLVEESVHKRGKCPVAPPTYNDDVVQGFKCPTVDCWKASEGLGVSVSLAAGHVACRLPIHRHQLRIPREVA
jgi:hypothetical protein